MKAIVATVLCLVVLPFCGSDAQGQTNLRVYFKADPATSIYGTADDILQGRGYGTLDFGHAFVVFEGKVDGVDINEAWGFHPAPGTEQNTFKLLVDTMPGEVTSDNPGAGRVYLMKTISDKTAWDRLRDIKELWNGQKETKPSNYEAILSNCVRFVDAIASEVGLRTPLTSRAIFPDTYMRQLAELNADNADYIPGPDSTYMPPLSLNMILDVRRWNTEAFMRRAYNADTKTFAEKWRQYAADKVMNAAVQFSSRENARGLFLNQQLQGLQRQGSGQASYNSGVMDQQQREFNRFREGRGFYIPGAPSGGAFPGNGPEGGSGGDVGAGIPGTPESYGCGSIFRFCTEVPPLPSPSPQRYLRSPAFSLLGSLAVGLENASWLRLAASESADLHNVLQMGLVLEGDVLRVELEFVAGSDGNYALVKYGSQLTAEWARPADKYYNPWNPNGVDRLFNSVDLRQGQSQKINLTFTPSSTSEGVTQLEIHFESRPLFMVTVDYLIAQAEQIGLATRVDNLVSGVGKDTNNTPYRICLGPAPVGYTLDGGSVSAAVTGPPAHPRSCPDGWAECPIVAASDSDICTSVKIQGHHGGSASPNPPTYVLGNAALAARYKLRRTPPVLIAVTH